MTEIASLPPLEKRDPLYDRNGGSVGDIVLTTYSCDTRHPKVDYDYKVKVGEDFRLIHKVVIGKHSSEWSIILPHSEYHGSSFPFETGSYGGGEAFQFSTDDKKIERFIVSYSDIIGDLGPETLWVQIGNFDPSLVGIVCGPIARKNLGKASA